MPRKSTNGRATPHGILPHREFVDAVPRADFDAYKSDPRVRVVDEAAFEQMRAHLKKLYAGVDVAHSFVDAAGQVFDCIPIEQQPSRRGVRGRLPKAPDIDALLYGGKKRRDHQAQPALPPLHPDRKDRHGNVMACPPGTIPMRRVTLDEMTRFETLRHFLQKSPGGGRTPKASTPSSDGSKNHRYAYAIQNVDNLGGHNFLNLWAPPVSSTQIFSLAQHWYRAGAPGSVQTVEVGWQVFPTKYNTTNPVLFQARNVFPASAGTAAARALHFASAPAALPKSVGW